MCLDATTTLRPRILLALALAWPLADPGAALGAQRVLGGAPDAVTLPRGALRVGIGGEHTMMSDRYRDGRVEGLGRGFSFDAFGPDQLAILRPLEQEIRALGATDFSASLGAVSLDLRQRVFVTPFSLEIGVTEWLTIGATAPLVRVRAEAQQRIQGATATLGFNPYYLGTAVPGTNRATIDAYASAATSLAARRDACVGNAGAFPECAIILAEPADVDALVSRTGAFATRLERTYGGAGGPDPSAYVPLAGSAAEQALLARVDSLRGALERYGVTHVTASTGLPLGAQVPLTVADLDALMRDSTFGYGARPLDHSARINIGDIDLGVKVRLFDSFGGLGAGAQGERLRADRVGLRQSVGLTYRLGTGVRGEPGDFLDLGTGTGEDAIGLRSYTDIVVNERFWASVVLGWAKARGEPASIRVPSVVGDQLLESWREVVAPVERGAVIQAEVSPRYHLNDYFAFGGYWGYRKRAADAYAVPDIATGAPPAAGTVTFDRAGMARAFASDEQRAGFHLTFSTFAAAAAGRASARFEVSYSHTESIASGSGIVPRRREDRLLVRYYTRLFGR